MCMWDFEAVIDVKKCSNNVKGSPLGDRGAHIGVKHGKTKAMLGMVKLRGQCEDPFVAFKIAALVVNSMQNDSVPVTNQSFYAKREEIIEGFSTDA